MADRSQAPSNRALLIATFLCGLCTMAVEMCASRLLAPAFGTSLPVWTNIIGVMMAALCCGYWVGGLAADRWPCRRVFGIIVLVAGCLAGAIPAVCSLILDLAVHRLSLDEFPGSLLATAVVFAPSVFLLGMVNPFAIRLASRDVAGLGRLSGAIYTLSTVGSLVGTLLPVLLTIPLIGTRATMYLFAVLLAATGVYGGCGCSPAVAAPDPDQTPVSSDDPRPEPASESR